MDELVRRRQQMGVSVRGWADVPGGLFEEGDGYWLMLSGVPSPDVNVAHVHGGGPAALRRVTEAIAAAGIPALLSLAGDIDGSDIGAGWQQVGTMPFMSVRLADTPTGPDSRVRPATAADTADVVALTAEAYGMEQVVAEAAVVPVVSRSSSMRFWLLEDGGEPVSTVLTARLDDAVTIWCMGTPARFGRRGYGRALLGHVLHAAAADGAEVGLLGATPAGLPLYEATGWRTLEEWRLHVNAPSVQFTG